MPSIAKPKVCKAGEILNPKTGNCVKINGATGKKVLTEHKSNTQFSHLPEEVVGSIIGFLPSTNKAKMKVVSKDMKRISNSQGESFYSVLAKVLRSIDKRFLTKLGNYQGKKAEWMLRLALDGDYNVDLSHKVVFSNKKATRVYTVQISTIDYSDQYINFTRLRRGSNGKKISAAYITANTLEELIRKLNQKFKEFQGVCIDATCTKKETSLILGIIENIKMDSFLEAIQNRSRMDAVLYYPRQFNDVELWFKNEVSQPMKPFADQSMFFYSD